jgi:drug/metabolite transporter (DMT)-like permease
MPSSFNLTYSWPAGLSCSNWKQDFEFKFPGKTGLNRFSWFHCYGGGGPVAMRATYHELAPFWVATSRFAPAALAFWVLAFYKKISLPKGRALLGVLIFGTLTFGLAFVLIAWSLVVLPTSLLQILMALVPLLTLLIASFYGVEAISRRGILGALLGVLGIAISIGGTSATAPHLGK